MKLKKSGGILLAAVFAAASILTTVQAANPSHIIPYTAGYDPVSYPQQQLDAAFTDKTIIVDGVADEAYENAPAARIDNLVSLNDYTYPEDKQTYGVLKSLWDGPVLYLLVEVHDYSVQRGTDADTGGPSRNPAVPASLDSVVFGIDLYNDKVLYETDTIGTFTIASNGSLYYYRNANIPSLGTPMADPIHPEYQNRIKDYAVAELLDDNGQSVGYTVELALQLEGLVLQNGTQLGMEIEICDVAVLKDEHDDVSDGNAAGQVSNGDWDYVVSGSDAAPAVSGGDSDSPDPQEYTPSPLASDAAPVRIGNLFWSHAQTALYTDLNHERPNAVDWGTLTLNGWNGTDSFAYSNWRLTNAIRYLDSIAFPKDVYTQESQAELEAARAQAEQQINAANNGIPDKTASDAAADRLEAAIRNLRWADTRYPDPDTLPDQMTLPNPYKFFRSNRIVESNEDWEERRTEILDMAQFYEYGYKPDAPDNMTIQKIQHYNTGDQRTILFWGFWPMTVTVTCPTDIVTLDITVGETTASLEFTVYSPTQEQLQTSGHTAGPVPVVLSYDGDNAVYRDAGFAVVEVPSASSGDVRTNEYAWGTRNGTFYTLYPYSRNGEGALKEVSSEMAAAWSATRVIDALEMMKDCSLDYASDIVAVADPDNLAVTGFSINGKYAFVAAVFDERIDVCIPGAAGASGPSPWRYVYTGHEYDWTDTLFAAAEGSGVSSVQISSGTEVMANSIRHNRVRETELFRQFLNSGNFYERLPGAYGYGTRLPYDQNDLIATLAPRAIVLENTVNDYNDGCEADSLGLQIAKSVYRTLGYDADDLVKFNQRAVQPGEPHGSDTMQRSRSAEYLNYYFYGVPLSEETNTYLNTDPFNLPISNSRTQSPYDYYYGGFNTITGGTGGVDGRDGWYYYSFPEKTVMADTSELESLYLSLSAKDLTGYTEESADALRQALANASSLLQMQLEDTPENRTLIADAIEALELADTGLTVKPSETPEPEDPSEPSKTPEPEAPSDASSPSQEDPDRDSGSDASQQGTAGPQNTSDSSPRTGDPSQIILWSTVLLGSVSGILFIILRQKKDQRI